MSECRDDFHLMVRNAKLYNQEGSYVYVDATELQRAFDATYEQLVPGSGLPGAEDPLPDIPVSAAGPSGTSGAIGTLLPTAEGGANGHAGGDDEQEEDGEDGGHDDENRGASAAPSGSRPGTSSGMKIKLKRRNETMEED